MNPVIEPGTDQRPAAIAVMGPTASGKTDAAVAWAERWGGEVVSVDSALVYRRLNIGSAKPEPALRARVRHHLIDVRDPHEVYSAADFAIAARTAVDDIVARGRLPLLVGGTGLYFRALLSGLSAMPEADPDLRVELEAEAASRGWPALHGELAQVDPAAARRIRPGDAQRIQRALEVWRLSGRSISDWQSDASAAPRFPCRVLKLVLAPPDRALLHQRIAHRFDLMLQAGLLDEVRDLRSDPRLHTALPAVRAVGYRQAWAYLQGEVDMPGLRAQGIAATRQLAKRQLTWLRRELDAFWIDPATQLSHAERLIDGFLGRGV